ncbi:hypothetical protein [Micromonospora auratinigra]|uniref:Uncharacterized protein n=1 Tax=Micromonospora auratinigra TaxID=261654 RepID=A0A1A8ZKC7_9ACTN|nr:hypothetical protein [Micromonospora auratinigra]SBT44521.1 hypothetical protein GA0070611_2714 [Micromonospora auratinigra]
MTRFEEYAALARELSARQRGGEQAVAAEAARRRSLQGAVDQLGQRLAAQRQRLDQLGRAGGIDTPPEAPVPPAVAGSGPVAAGSTGPAADGAASVPGDPAAELAAAGRLADEADRYGREAEALAHRPVLLPTWSAPARAVAVYAGCALAGSVLMLALLVGSPVPVGGLDLVAAAACAGVPLLSFVAGQLVLARWGRPAIADGTPPGRYVPLGFVLCALLSSGFFCLYLVAFRLLR